jgi:hypothetical protein
LLLGETLLPPSFPESGPTDSSDLRPASRSLPAEFNAMNQHPEVSLFRPRFRTRLSFGARRRSAFVALHRQLIFEQAAQHRLPAVYEFRYFAADGGLMSYGVDVRDRRPEKRSSRPAKQWTAQCWMRT